jgi:predicted Zn finger-like uncharacterized protein
MIITCPHCQSSFKVADDAIGTNGRAVRCSSCNHQWIEFHPPEKNIPNRELNKDNIVSKSNIESDIKSRTNFDTQKQTAHEGLQNEEVPDEEILDKKIPDKEPAENVEEKIIPKREETIETPFYDIPTVRYLSYALCTLSLVILAVLAFLAAAGFLSIKLKNFPLSEKFFSFITSNELKLEEVDFTFNNKDHSPTLRNLSAKIVVHNTSSSTKNLDYVRLTLFDKNRKKIDYFVIHLKQPVQPYSTKLIENRFDNIPCDTKFIAVDLANFIDLKIRPVNSLEN